MDGARLSQLIVSSYINEDQRITDPAARADFLQGGSPLGGLFGSNSSSAAQVIAQMEKNITISSIDLQKLPALMQSMNDFAYALQDEDQRLVAEARNYTQSYTSIFGREVPPSYIDLGHFAVLLANNTSNSRVKGAATQLVGALQEPGKPTPALVPAAKPRARTKSGNPVVIPGLGDVPMTLARCCKPQPPDAIVAYTTVGRGLTVHRADCAALRRANPARMLTAEWVLDAGAAFEVDILLKAFDRQGLLRDISDVIAKDRLDVLRVNTESRDEYANMRITVRIKELQQLSRLLARLQHVQNVIEVRRG